MDGFNEIIKSNSIRKLKDFHRTADHYLLKGDVVLNIKTNTYCLLVDILIGNSNTKIYTFLEFPESPTVTGCTNVELGYSIDDKFYKLNEMNPYTTLIEESAIRFEEFLLGGSENPDLRYICNVKNYQHLYSAFKHLYNGRKLQISWGYDSKIKLYDIRVIISDFDSVNSTSKDPGIVVSFKDETNCERKMSIDEFVYQYTY